MNEENNQFSEEWKFKEKPLASYRHQNHIV